MQCVWYYVRWSSVGGGSGLGFTGDIRDIKTDRIHAERGCRE